MNLPVTLQVYRNREEKSMEMMSRFVTLGFQLCEILSDIGKGQLSRLASALARASIKFTVPPPILGMLAQVDRCDPDSLIAPDGLLSGFERSGTGEHRFIA
jgi:hypothetical protein